jgi:hypothetical protein
MSTKQERRLHVHKREGVGGQRSALSDTWSATLAQPTMPSKRSAGGIGPNRRSRLRGRRPEGKARAKPEHEAGAEGHRTFVRPRRGEAQDGPNDGCGTGRLRVGKRSATEHAWRAIRGGAA